MAAQWSNPIPVLFKDNYLGGSASTHQQNIVTGNNRAGAGYDNSTGAMSTLGSIAGKNLNGIGGLTSGTTEYDLFRQGQGMLTNRSAPGFNGALVDTAKQNTASVAEALARQNQSANARTMMAQAAAARGGNQAAALRSAQATGAQNSLQTGEQLAALRAQEEQQRLARVIQAQQATAALNMQSRAQNDQLGLSLQNAGLGQALARAGLQNQATGNQISAASGMGQLGLGLQNLYTGTNLQRDLAQLQQEQEDQNQRAAFIGGLIQTGGKAVGSMMGGA